jgi:hypothetical protein
MVRSARMGCVAPLGRLVRSHFTLVYDYMINHYIYIYMRKERNKVLRKQYPNQINLSNKAGQLNIIILHFTSH